MVAQGEMHRAEDFLNAFNTIDAELKRRTGMDHSNSFSAAVRTYAKRNPWWQRDADALQAFSDLRNVIVHQRYERFQYLSLPSPEVVEEIQAIRDRLLEPPTAYEQFGDREVVSVGEGTPLPELFELIERHEFTQFPVYGDDGFEGLVTSNGLAHWVAQQARKMSLIDFESHTVADLLTREEKRPNWGFVSREMPLDELLYLFVENPQLEAVLITENGKKGEAPLGIVTPSDVAAIRRNWG